MAIQDILNSLLSEKLMKNMQQHMVDGLEQVYKDATFDGNTNMEVLRARGSESTLVDRLDKSDSTQQEVAVQLAKTGSQIGTLDSGKADKTELDKKRDKTTQLLLIDLSTEVKTAMTGGSVPTVGVNSVSTDNIIDNTVTPAKTTEMIKLNLYPFQSRATLLNKPEIINAVKDIKLFNADSSKEYYMGLLRKNTGGLFQVNIYDSSGVNVCSFYKSVYTPVMGVLDEKLLMSTSSGITGRILIDWSQLSEGAWHSGMTYDVAGLDSKTHVDLTSTLAKENTLALNSTINNGDTSLLNKLKMSQAIFNMRIYGLQSTHTYGISRILKKNNGNVYQIDITDYTLNQAVASFYSSSYAESVINTISFLALNSSGITGTAQVRWSFIPDGAYTETLPIYISSNGLAVSIETTWNGKKWLALGDSITIRDGNYTSQVASKLGLTCTNRAISGANSYEFLDNVVSGDIENADLITIWGFVNDFAPTTVKPMGTIYDAPVKQGTTFASRVKWLIEEILKVKPTAKIVLIGTTNADDTYRPELNQPINTEISGSSTIKDFVEFLDELAFYYGNHFINMYHEAGFNAYTMDLYTADRVHPNSLGYEKIENVLVNDLKSIEPLV